MSGLIGEKLGMSRVFNEDGSTHAVTYVLVQPNTITRLKTEDKDGYNAIVVGYKKLKKEKKTKKYHHEREFKVENVEEFKVGDTLTVDKLQEIEQVTISSVSKGKGFQGVMKRYGFHGGPQTHGSGHKREPGSVGACAKPGRIKKGKKLPGRMGNNKMTQRGRPVMSIDSKNNIVGIKGVIPGATKSLVTITIV